MCKRTLSSCLDGIASRWQLLFSRSSSLAPRISVAAVESAHEEFFGAAYVRQNGVPEEICPRSVQERDIARRHIQQINSELFKFLQERLDRRPARLELLPLVGFPIGPDVLRELRAEIEVCARE